MTRKEAERIEVEMENDPCFAYGRSVFDRVKPAGEWEYLAAKRYLKDLEVQHLEYTPQPLLDFQDFSRLLCVVEDHVNSKIVPLRLLPWQCFVFGNFLNFTVNKHDPLGRLPGSRRIRQVFLETPKGSGKTASIVAFFLWHMSIFDKELNPQIVMAASNLDQIKITEDFFVMQLKNNKFWQDEIKFRNKEYHSRYGGKLKALSSKDTGKAGMQPSFAYFDEYFENNNKKLLNSVNMGFKSRRQPALWLTTNPGFMEETNDCWRLHKNCEKMLKGIQDVDTLFAFITRAPEKYDRRSENDRIAANPSYGFTVRKDYYETKLAECQDEFALIEYDRLLMGVWPKTREGMWFQEDEWSKHYVVTNRSDQVKYGMEHGIEIPMYKIPDRPDRSCLGFDLAKTNDCVAVVIGKKKGENIYLEPYTFMTENTYNSISHKGGPELDRWISDGHLRICGVSAYDQDEICKFMVQESQKHNLMDWIGDTWGHTRFNQDLSKHLTDFIPYEQVRKDREGLGNPLRPFPKVRILDHPTGVANNEKVNYEYFAMHKSMKIFRRLLREGKIKIKVHPPFGWNCKCAAHVIKHSGKGSGDEYLDKHASEARMDGKIDTLVACIQTVAYLTYEDWSKKKSKPLAYFGSQF